MNDNVSVNLANFNHGSGFDAAADASAAAVSQEQLADLSKALEAGSLQGGDMDSAGQTNGGALKTESLESALKIITFKESDIRFWKRFPKAAAYNTVEEYNQLTSFGTDRGGFNNEGELPEEEDSQYVRKAQHVKYLGVTKSVTHQMQLVNTNIGSVVQRETTNGILWILRKADRALFYGDEALVRQEWNGMYAQHLNNDEFASLDEYLNSNLVIDLRGKVLQEGDIEAGAQTMLQRFAHANLLVAPPVVLSDYAKNFYARQRIAAGGGSDKGNVSNVTTGNHISNFQSMYGLIEFEFDIFGAKPSGKFGAALSSSPKAPSVPTAGATATAVVLNDGLTKFADGVGDYIYGVSAVNRYGESSIADLGTVTVANASDSVDLTFTATPGAYTPTSYIVYRSKKNPTTPFALTTLYPIAFVPATGSDAKRGSLVNGVDGAAAGSVRDRNRILPDTQDAMLLQGDSEVMEFKQLAPLMKMPLAKLSPADRFMVLLYGTPILYQPTKMIKYINVGREIA